MREWQGRAHEVIVLADGYLWKGERYGSLSVIAQHITGAHWSGPRFFGTRKAVPARSQAGVAGADTGAANERSVAGAEAGAAKERRAAGADAGAAKECHVAGVEAGDAKERRVAGVDAGDVKERRAAVAARRPIASAASAPKAGLAIHGSGSDA